MLSTGAVKHKCSHATTVLSGKLLTSCMNASVYMQKLLKCIGHVHTCIHMKYTDHQNTHTPQICMHMCYDFHTGSIDYNDEMSIFPISVRQNYFRSVTQCQNKHTTQKATQNTLELDSLGSSDISFV